jgi:hypothetical protein
MILKLNAEAVGYLEAIMSRTGYTSHTHCCQVMLSQVMKKLLLADAKKKVESNLHNI